MTLEQEKLIRDYAEGAVSWSIVRQRGFPNYLMVLAALDEFGLRPPKPDLQKQIPARAIIRDALTAIDR